MTTDDTTAPTTGAYTVAGFCTAHGISRCLFYRLAATGRAPRTMQVGRRVLISVEAAADWRRAMESTSSGRAA